MRHFRHYNRSLAWFWLLAMVFTLAGRPVYAVAACGDAMASSGAPASSRAEQSRMACAVDQSQREACCCSSKAGASHGADKTSDPVSLHHDAAHGKLAACDCRWESTPAQSPAERPTTRSNLAPDGTAHVVAAPIFLFVPLVAGPTFETHTESHPSLDRLPSGSRAPPAL